MGVGEGGGGGVVRGLRDHELTRYLTIMRATIDAFTGKVIKIQ